MVRRGGVPYYLRRVASFLAEIKPLSDQVTSWPSGQQDVPKY